MSTPPDHLPDTAASLGPIAEIIAGPDCRSPMQLGVGRFVLGRDPSCDITLADDTVARFHAVVDVRSAPESLSAIGDWSIAVVPLVGAQPTRVDGHPMAASSAGERWRPLGCGSLITVGSSVVAVRPGGPDRTDDPAEQVATSRLVPHGDGRSVVHRRFAVGHDPEPPTVRMPDDPVHVPSPPATGLVAALVGAAGALVVTTVIGSATMAVFAVVAASASLLMWSGSWLRVVRARRRARSDHADDVDRFARDLHAARATAEHTERCRSPGIAVALRAGSASGTLVPGLWVDRPRPEERPGQPIRRSFRVVVGLGRRRWAAPLMSSSGASSAPSDAAAVERLGLPTDLTDVPITIGLTEGRAVAVSGRRRRSVVRSIVGQLAWSAGPSAWGLTVATDAPHRWSWIEHLPQARAGHSIIDLSATIIDATAARRLADALSADADPTAPVQLVLADLASDRAEIDAALRALQDRPGVATLVLVDDPPSWVDEVVDVGPIGVVEHRRPGGGDAIAGVGVGISRPTAASIASWLGRLIDPEVIDTGSIPDRCGFIETHTTVAGSEDCALGHRAITEWWSAGGDDPPPIASLGIDRSGPVLVDLAADGPHVLLAGTTGSGKSEFLRTLVLGLAVRSSPAHLGVVLVDYKGGAAFDACSALPHVLGSVTDLDDGLAARALSGLEAELRRRSERFRAVGASDLHEYRGRGGTAAEPMPRIVVVVDEFATLAKEQPDFLASLVDVAQRGRSLGVHLVLATQRPAGVVSEDIRANTALRFALRTEDESDSRDVIGSGAAAKVSRRTPGRTFRRLDDGTLAEFQVAGTAGRPPGGSRSSELEHVVASIAEADGRHAGPRVAPLWLPPLPRVIEPDRLDAELLVGAGPGFRSDGLAEAVGVVDDPEHRCRHPLTWSPGNGSLLLLGSVGAGCTSTLIALGAAACAGAAPDEVHLGVIDALGDRRLDVFESLAHSLGSVQSHDTERLRRLLDRLVDGVAGLDEGRRARTIVLIDGLDALWHQLVVPDPTMDAGLAVSLRNLVSRGGDLDIDVVATARGGPLPTGFSARETWVGALDDPTVARTVGWRGDLIGRAGPGRFGVVSSGLVAQVARGAAALADLPLRSAGAGGPDPVRCLPTHVAMSELADAVDVAERDRLDLSAGTLPIGIDADLLLPAGPRLEPGRHLLVVGRPGSGVTATLRTIRHVWCAHHPSGLVIEMVDDAALEVAEGAGVGDSSGEAVLVLVDDAHRIIDRDGRLGRLLDHRAAGASGRGVSSQVTVVAGVRLESFRAAYGHWTRSLAAAEHGIALTTSGEPPTDVFGVAAPRRPVVAPRPGLGWLVDGGRVRAIQIATAEVA